MTYNNYLPEGYNLILLGDGYRAVLKALVKSIKYPGRVTLIGKIPRKSWLYLISDFCRIVLPDEADIHSSTLMALHDSLDANRQSLPLLKTLNEKYESIIRINAKKIEDSFIIAGVD